MRLRVPSRLRTMTPDDYRVLVRAYVDLAMMAARLRLSGYTCVTNRIQRADEPMPFVLTLDVLARARRYAGFIRIAARYHVIRAECLLRSLVLHQWLRDEGLPSELRIGVRKDGQELMGHAWVELGDRIVNDRRVDVMPFKRMSAARQASLLLEEAGASMFLARTR